MQPIRKFYAVSTPGGGGGNQGQTGPSQQDVNNAEALNEQFARLKNTLTSIGATFKTQLTQQAENLDFVTRRTATQTINSLEGQFKRAAAQVDKTRLASEGVDKALLSSKKIAERITAIKSRQSSLENQILELERLGITLSDKQQEKYYYAQEALKEQLEIEEKLLEVAKKRDRAIGRIGDLFRGLTRIPVVGNLIDARDVLDDIEKAADKTGSKWKAFGAGMLSVFKSIGRSLTDPAIIVGSIVAIIAKIISLVREFNQIVFDLSKNLGVSVDKARELQNQFIDITTNSANLGLQIAEVSKTFVELTNEMGFLVPQSAEFAENAALIQKRLGVSAKEMAVLATQSAISGKSLLDTYKTLELSRVTEGVRNKLQLTQKQQLEAIAKLSSTVVLNFKGSVDELGKAVIRAAKLGTTLDTVNKQGEALLDFETSISKEFEAQLLGGREINLTRAREFALMGQTANLMEELNRQGATYDQFMNMNVIARQAEAEAIGLSVEEYSKILLQQKQVNALGAEQGESLQETYNRLIREGKTRKEIADLITASAEKDLYKSSINDKFLAATEKLKMTLGSMLEGPVGGLVDKFAAFVSNAAEMNKLVTNIKNVFSGIVSFASKLPNLLSAAVTASKILLSLSIARAVASTVAGLSLGGPAGVVAGAIAGGLMYSWLNSLTTGMGGGAPPIPGGGGEAMTAPVNTPAALAQANQAALAESTAKPPVFNFKQTTYVGTENWSSQTRSSLQTDPGTSIQ
jgi:hypothetical protein